MKKAKWWIVYLVCAAIAGGIFAEVTLSGSLWPNTVGGWSSSEDASVPSSSTIDAYVGIDDGSTLYANTLRVTAYYKSSSVGTINISGAGSLLQVSRLEIGAEGTGYLNVEDGAQFACSGILAEIANNYQTSGENGFGKVVARGVGTSLYFGSNVYISETGTYGVYSKATGVMELRDGATASVGHTVAIGPRGTLVIDVTGNGQLHFYNTVVATSINGLGELKLIADRSLADGVYTPITGLDNMYLSNIKTFGGIWDSNNKTFVVGAVQETSLGETNQIDTSVASRVSADDGYVTLDFIGSKGSFGLTVTRPDPDHEADLASTLDEGEGVLSAYNFSQSVGYTGDETILSHYVGTNFTDTSELKIWHSDGTSWTLYEPEDVRLTDDGYLQFSVAGFSGYAVTGEVTIDPASDEDGDGLTYEEEILAGTDPNDPDSVFAANVAEVAGDEMTLTWPSVSNRSYLVEFCTNLVEGAWTNEWAEISANPPQNTVVVTNAGNQIFYRIQVSNPGD